MIMDLSGDCEKLSCLRPLRLKKKVFDQDAGGDSIYRFCLGLTRFGFVGGEIFVHFMYGQPEFRKH